MSPFRALPALAALLACSGCGYIHFGRLPRETAPTGDAQLATAYTDLRTEHKILQQELALARREGDALRSALDKGGGGADLAARLQETTRELTALRESYAKLSNPKSTAATSQPGAVADAMVRAALEEKLASSLRNYTQLQGENSRLRADVTRTREENTTLTTRLKTVAAQNDQAQAALSQLNTELLAQKEARARADQQAEAARAQLALVVARTADLAVTSRTGADAKPTLADARESSATGATVIAAPSEASRAEALAKAGLRLTHAPASDAPPTAELRTNPERIRAAAQAKPNAAPPETPDAPGPRMHIVRANETLEFIAKKYYGDPAKWTRIYVANNSQLSGGRPIKLGMELVIPED